MLAAGKVSASNDAVPAPQQSTLSSQYITSSGIQSKNLASLAAQSADQAVA